MNLSRLFILRPVATSLLMAALLLSGLLAWRLLPLAALPQIDYPTIQVTTLYPGAGPEVVSTAITAPLERQFGMVSGLKQLSSVSSGGSSVITLQFELHMELDIAEQEVQAAINGAGNLLPSDLPAPPVYNKVNPADPPILTLAATSNVLPLTKLEDLVDTRLAQKISQISGVGMVTISGGQRPAVRIQVNPQALASKGFTLENIRSAIATANVNSAKGSFDGPMRASTIDANDQLADAQQYAEVIIGYSNGAPLRIRDIAEVVDGAENVRLAAWVSNPEYIAANADNTINTDDIDNAIPLDASTQNSLIPQGKEHTLRPAIVVSVQRQPGANVISTADSILELIPQITATFPADVHIQVLTDRTTTIRATIKDVMIELTLAVLLVILVIWVFLRNVPATIIPGLAVPLSLIGTLGVMYLVGFSLNNLTLMALTIATGFVVDDAIVVIENIARYLEKGESPINAALHGAGQIGFTIISLTISLVAVLIPLLFMSDVAGRLFREFAITLAVAILISGVISLTLTPMMCAQILRPMHNDAPETGFFARLLDSYAHMLDWVLARQGLVLGIAIATLVATVLLYIYVPKGFFPVQDTGVIQGVAEFRQSSSFEAMSKNQQRLAEVLLRDPDVQSLVCFVGVDGINASLNASRLTVNLKPLADRSKRAPAIARRLMRQANAQPDMQLFLQPVQDLTIEDRVSRTQYQLTLEAIDREQLLTWAPRLQAELAQQPSLRNVATDVQNKGLQAYINVNRDAAGRMGVSMADVDTALYNALGQRLISTIFTQTNQYRVILEVAPNFRQGPSALSNIHVKAKDGTTVPLSSFATVEERPALLAINRQGQFPAATLSFNLAKNASLGEAVDEVEYAIQNAGLPSSMRTLFQGSASAFMSSSDNQAWLILAAIITMYIVLGVLYESYIHPMTILSTLPSAGVGALLALLAARMDLGVVAIIGIILLIGIVKKNAIMMIDFALDAEREQGLTPYDAIRQACLLRLRPILMTTFAALLGALPLMIGWGMGAELRRPLGVTMVGGLIFSQILTLFTTPVVYLWFDRLGRKLGQDSGTGFHSHHSSPAKEHNGVRRNGTQHAASPQTAPQTHHSLAEQFPHGHGADTWCDAQAQDGKPV